MLRAAHQDRAALQVRRVRVTQASDRLIETSHNSHPATDVTENLYPFLHFASKYPNFFLKKELEMHFALCRMQRPRKEEEKGKGAQSCLLERA